LIPGGYLVGQCLDSSEIYARVWKRKTTDSLTVVTKGGLMQIQFQNDRFEHTGSAYRIIINNNRTGGGSDTLHYLIHFPTLLRIAKQFQLRMIEITNANEFYEENKRIYNDSLKQWGVLQKSYKFKFLPEQRDVLGK
jgi:mRNA (guanine-N7-)-methyltransferase